MKRINNLQQVPGTAEHLQVLENALRDRQSWVEAWVGVYALGNGKVPFRSSKWAVCKTQIRLGGWKV
jgi:hypothetical protein